MATTTASFDKLLDPGLRRIYGDAYKSYEEQYTKIFSVETSAKSNEKSLSMSGFGLVPQKVESASVDYDAPIQGFSHTITHLTFGKGFTVSKEMFEDDLYRKINALPKALARSVRVTIETRSANILNNAFVTTYNTGPDALELCSTVHKRIDGVTFANELTTAADFSMTSLRQALIDIGDYVDDRGLLMAAKPMKLIGPPELEWDFRRVLQSTGDPETANRSMNPAQGVLPYTVNNYLTDPDAWFIQTDVDNGLVYYWRRRPSFTKDNDFDSENGKWKVTYRMSVGWDDPRNIFGSPGA